MNVQDPDAELYNDEIPQEQRSSWRILFSFASNRHTTTFVEGVMLSVIAGILVPAFACLLGRIFEDFSELGAGAKEAHAFSQEVVTNVKYLIILGSASCLVNAAFLFIWVAFGELQAHSIRGRLFDTISNKSVAWFDVREGGGGAIIQTLRSHVRNLQTAISQPLGFVIHYTVTCLAALALAFWNAWDLTLITLATVPIALIVLAFVSARMQPAIAGQTEELAAATRQIKNLVEAIDVVKSFNGQYAEVLKYLDTIESAASYCRSQARWNAIQIGFVRLLTRALFVQGFWFGSHLVQAGSKTSGQILTAFWGCLMATQTFEQILPQALILERGRSSANHLKAFLKKEELTTIHDEAGCQLVNCKGDIRFTNVRFAYPSRPRALALRGIDMVLPANRTTFVVGRSGSGKSTLASLLLCFYTGWTGHITLDGVPVQSINLYSLRQNVALISQDNTLFDDTLMKNIAFGKSDDEPIRRSTIGRAITTASLTDVVDALPKGLDTWLGVNGTGLSGGQIQRVAIARALVRNASVLILDECTSALDRATAMTVMKAILKQRKGKTNIVITHDLSHIAQHDHVCVLAEGKLVQQGMKSTLEENKVAGPGAKAQKAKDDSPRKNPYRTAGDSEPSPHTPVSTNGSRKTTLRNPFSTPEHTYNSLIGYVAERDTGTHLPSRQTEGRMSSIETSIPVISIASNGLIGARSSFSRASVLHDKTNHRISQMSIPVGTATQGIEDYKNARSSWHQRRKKISEVELDIIREVGASDKNHVDRTEGDSIDQMAILSLTKILMTVWTRLDTRRRLYCCFGFLFAGVHAACTPVFSWVFAQLLATYFNSVDREQKALRLSLLLLGISFADSASSFLTHYLLESSAQFWADKIRFDAMRRILEQPKSWYDGANAQVPDIVEQLNGGAEEMKCLIGRFAGYLVIAAVMMIVGLVWCVIVSWRLTLVGVSAAPMMYALTSTFDIVSTKWEGRSYEAVQAAFGILSEVADKITTVRSHCLEGFFLQKHDAASKGALHVGIKRATASSLFFGISDASIFFVTALTFWYGSTLAASDPSAVRAIITVFSMLLFVISNVNAIVAFIPQLTSAKHAATKLLGLSKLSPLDNHEHLGDTRLDELPGSIRFRKMCFRYPSQPSKMVLSCLTLEILRHRSTALVGRSGSGKSTAISLLLRLHDLSGALTSGTLKIGDIPLAQLDVFCWRSLLAYVPQKPTLFPGTISENITFGLPLRSPYRRHDIVRNAAFHSGLGDFISSLPEGYETIVGEGGTGLSGGQRQKLAIARALIRRPKFLVLDEPTSSLDAASAEDVRLLIKGLVEIDRMTVLVATHSTEMMRIVDKVAVLEKGRVVEQGSFEALLARNGQLRKVLGEDGHTE